jgi:hypothetical protein
MFDLLASIGSAAIGDIIKRAIAAGIDWVSVARSRRLKKLGKRWRN